MPEVILPCPACGSTDCECLVCTINADESQTIHFHMACNKCFTSGPIADDAESAKKLLDSMPRALRWTHEPPKVAGDCYVRMRSDESGQWKNPFVEHFSEGYLKELKATPLMQFAGPIPAPVEEKP